MKNVNNSYFFSWVRKGIGNSISEKDVLGPVTEEMGLATRSPYLLLTAEIESTPVQKEEKKDKSSSKKKADEGETGKKDILKKDRKINVASAADILSVSKNAIINVRPAPGSFGYPIDYYPYIEFWEPDFAWRYTPAIHSDAKLRPWLALVVCESSLCSVSQNRNGVGTVSFKIDNKEDYAQIFCPPDEVWRSAHAQGVTEDKADFCRILALRAAPYLKENTDYTALLIPVFEVGRLRGLGFDEKELKTVIAQAPAWEKTLTEQKKSHKSPLIFPAYYSWTFKTGIVSFDMLVARLKPYVPKKTGVTVDVTGMGEGLDYAVLTTKPKQQTIEIPAVTEAANPKKEASFPSSSGDQSEVYKNLSYLLTKSPVFFENLEAIGDGNTITGEDKDDPWVVPPIYGAKHIMATSLSPKDNKQTPWLLQLNLDVHYRAIAGLGKEVIRRNQEKLVHRAWQQAELVKALNNELYKKLIAYQVNKSLRNKYPWLNNSSSISFIANLLVNLSSLRNAEAESNGIKTSLSSILSDSNIPQSFASASFQNVTNRLSSQIGNMNLTSLMENVASGQIYRMPEPASYNLPTVAQLDSVTEFLFGRLSEYIINDLLGDFLKVERTYSKDEGENYRFSMNPDSCRSGDSNRISTRHYAHYYHYVNYDGEPDSRRLYQKMEEFIQNNGHKTCCRGYVIDSSHFSSLSNTLFSDGDLGDPCMIGMHEDDYNKIFGKKIITRIGDNFKFYFFSIQGLLKEVLVNPRLRCAVRCFINYFWAGYETNYKGMTGGPSGSAWTKPVYETVVEYIYKNMLAEDGNIIIPSYVDAYFPNGLRYNDKFHYVQERFDAESCFSPTYYKGTYQRWPWQELVNKLINDTFDICNLGHTDVPEHILNLPNEDIDKYKKIHDTVVNYLLRTPDFVVVDIAGVDEKLIQSFATPTEFLSAFKDQAIANAQNSSVNDVVVSYPALKVWGHLRNDVNHLIEIRDLYNSKKQAMGSAPDEKKIKILRNGITDVDAMARIEETAMGYYSAFISDPSLIKDYLEDLLRSRYPIMAYPIFPEPTYYYLKMISDKFFLPCIGELPDDSVCMLKNNEAFVESFLCGMNTEMGRELLWREYPTDQRGSYFKKFWDQDNDLSSIKQKAFFDVKDLHTWSGNLGENHNANKTGLLLFIVKSDLFRVYPKTEIYLQRVVGKVADKQIVLSPDRSDNDQDVIILPSSQAYLKEDIYIVGFRINLPTAVGNPDKGDYGFMLVFKQPLEDLDFKTAGPITDEARSDDSVLATSDAGAFAEKLIDTPTIYGRHIIAFINI